MLFRRYGTFTGGIDLPDEKHSTLDAPIGAWKRPEKLLLPLAPCRGASARPIVQPGENVTTGERIAIGGNGAVDIFAPLAGRVAKLTTAPIVRRRAMAMVPAIELRDLSRPTGICALSEVFDWKNASAEALRARIAEGGLTTHRSDPISLARWIERAVAKKCDVLIANVMEGEPFVTSAHRLLVEHGADVIRGLAILGRCMGAVRTILVVDQRRTDDYRELVAPARTYSIVRIALEPKYPLGADNILLKVLRRREVPPGSSPMDVGTAVIDAATCFATYRQVACGAPQSSRVVTVSGDRVEKSGNFWVPFGIACESLVGRAEPPVIHGGPMTGVRTGGDLPTGPSTDAVLAINAAAPAAPTPCIRCSWCTDHCPARLNVAALNDMFELAEIDRARRAGVLACVDCGVCSYVCPARLPLSQRVRQLKRAIYERREAAPLFSEK